MGRLRSKFVIVCLAVLISLVGVCSPRVRAFAAAKLSSIQSTHKPLTESGPIPYILDLSKRKPHKTAPKPPAKTTAKTKKSTVNSR